MTAVAEDKDAYRASFERFASAHASSDPAWLRERRTAAIARFVEKGLPTPRDEAWRHTPLAPLAKGRFEPADPAATPPPAVLEALPREGFRGAHAVFVNGRLSPALSSLEAGEKGVEVASLRDLLRSSARPRRALARPRGRRPDRRLRRPQHGLRRGRRRRDRGPRRRPGGARPRRARRHRGGGAHRLLRAHPRGGRARERVPGRGDLRLAGRPGLARERGDGGRGRGQRLRGPLQAPAGGGRVAPRGDPRRAARPRRALLRPLDLLRGRPLAQRHRGALRGRGRGVRAQRALRGGRPPGGRHPLDGRPREAALLEPRALQGRPRRPGPRRLQRAGGGAPRRAEDRRRADEPEPAPLPRGARALDPAARDPGRRRQVQARLHHRASSTRTPSSTCAPAGSASRRRGPSSPGPSRATSSRKMAVEPLRRAGRARSCSRGSRGASTSRRPSRERAGDGRPRRGGHPPGVPGPPRDGPREAPRLPRLRGQRPEAAGGDRRRAPRLRALLLEHPPRRPPPLDAGDRTPTRGHARRCSASWAPGRAARSCSCAAPPRR